MTLPRSTRPSDHHPRSRRPAGLWRLLAAGLWIALAAGCQGSSREGGPTSRQEGQRGDRPANGTETGSSSASSAALALSEPAPPLPSTTPTPAIPAFPPDRPARAPDLLLITIDALRPDRLPVYGSPRDTAPHLATFARQAVVFDHAFAHASETQASMPALLTGRFPAGPVWEEIPPGMGLAERLKAAGYRTGAFVGNAWLAPERGYGRGFDRWVSIDYVYPPDAEDRSGRGPARVDGATLVGEAVAFLKASQKPTFVWLHLMDVHNPYQPPPPYRGMFATAPGTDRYVNGPMPAALEPADLTFMQARYDEGIRYTDALLRPLWEMLAVKDRFDRTWVVVTSDHGETFGEHGRLGHGTSLSLEQVRVPLLVRRPAGEGGGARIARSVALFDVMPTLLGAAGVVAQGLDGVDLRGLIAAPGSEAARVGGVDDRLLPQGVRSVFDGGLWLGGFQGPDHLYYPSGSDRTHHHRWLEDPGERVDLAPRADARTGALRATVEQYFSARGTGEPPPPLVTGRRAQLEALGYIGRP